MGDGRVGQIRGMISGGAEQALVLQGRDFRVVLGAATGVAPAALFPAQGAW